MLKRETRQDHQWIFWLSDNRVSQVIDRRMLKRETRQGYQWIFWLSDNRVSQVIDRRMLTREQDRAIGESFGSLTIESHR